jgi:H+-transporting ATPase
MSKKKSNNDESSQKQDEFASMSIGELESKLNCSGEGLSNQDAQSRLSEYGYNELEEKEENPLLKFLSYLWGPIPWMIEIAAILSALVQNWSDFGIITALLVVNALVGFWEEHKAGNTIAALKKELALNALIKRGGKWGKIPAREVVPGDVMRLRLGDIVPADSKLFEGDPVEVDQSALTGESLPVTRGPGDVLYSGSVLKQGESDALVYATGGNTFFGKTAKLVETAHTVSHFQKAVLKIGDYLIVVAMCAVALILGVALFRGDDMLQTLEFALVLTVAAVPVAMPTVLSVTMAVGARLLALKQAIVTRLASIEEIAGMDILCSDKTGTLTQNKLTLGEPFTVSGIKPEDVILYACLASRLEDQDPIDLAVLGGLKEDITKSGYDVIHFTPFDPVHKRTEAKVKSKSGGTLQVTKGAPQVILAMAEISDDIKSEVEQKINEFASRGFRSLGVAKTDNGGNWQFLGVLPLYDPPRTDAKATIAMAKEMGIKVKMVTGDQVVIGKEIAQELGLGTNILDANILSDAKPYEQGQIDEEIEKADGFAQVFPEHKYHIVDVLQKRGHITGMTGDGVNDAPALKKADAGIAVSGATDAARLAADIVLLTPGLSIIIEAIKESRKIFVRMNSYAIYRITETINVLLFMTLAILIFNFYPVTAVMIVLLALLNDGAILSIAYDRTHYSALPEAWNMKLVLGISSMLGLLGVIETFGLFYIAEQYLGLNREIVQPLIYLNLSVGGHLTVFVARTRGPFWSIRPAYILLGAVIVTQLIATLLSVYGILMPALGWKYAGMVWVYSLGWFFIADVVKLFAYKIFAQPHTAIYPKAVNI